MGLETLPGIAQNSQPWSEVLSLDLTAIHVITRVNYNCEKGILEGIAYAVAQSVESEGVESEGLKIEGSNHILYILDMKWVDSFEITRISYKANKIVTIKDKIFQSKG